MTNGIGGKVITYDGENCPLSVLYAGKLTCYVYGADGARLKKITSSTATTCPSQNTIGVGVTLYAGHLEIRNWRNGAGGSDQATNPAGQIFVTPLPNIRLAFTTPNSTTYTWTAIHRDAQGSVRGVTGPALVNNVMTTGQKWERTIYRPYGNWSDTLTAQWDQTKLAESHGYIGERLDADEGLLYLNARYMDPQLGMFIQPDWWEVSEPGVGTNRYAYAGGDPVNGKDPGGRVRGAAPCSSSSLGLAANLSIL